MRYPSRPTAPLAAFVGFVAVVAALHFAKGLLVPIALAGLLALLLVPLVRRLERWGVRPGAAVGLATGTALLLVASFAWVLTLQIADLAERLPSYRTNIAARTETLGAAGSYVARTYTAFERLGAEVLSSAERSAPPQPDRDVPVVAVVEPPTSPVRTLTRVVFAGAESIGTAVIVFVLVNFLLVFRQDLGDRIVHVFGRGSVHLTSQTIGESAENISRYLVLQSLVNGAFGLAAGIGLALLGVPNAVLWGLLAALLRFVPYLGVWLALVVPLLLSLAVSTSWSAPLALVLGWLALEIATANVVEPWVYGRRTAVSPLGVMLGALFWTWLWGPAGLVLAIPMTVSVMALGRAMPQLSFLGTLFGSTTALEPKVQLYHRLLAMEPDAAIALVADFREDRPLVEVCDTLLVPALALAEADRHGRDLDEDRAAAVIENMNAVVEDLDESPAAGTADDGSAPRVLVVPAADDADEAVARMLVACLAAAGVRAEALPAAMTSDEKARRVRDEGCRLVFISALPPSASVPARLLKKRLRVRCPALPVVVGLWAAPTNAPLAAERVAPGGDARLVTTLADAVREVANENGRPAPARPSADRVRTA